MRVTALAVATVLAALGTAQAGPADFTPGPAIADYGRVASVPTSEPIPSGAVFRVAFDVAEAGQPGAVNRRLDSAARFVNLHVAAGVPAENIAVAVVIHGPAARDLTRTTADGQANINAGLIAALIEHGVQIYLCGQTAAAMDIAPADLLPGVRMALSAMTEHALLQQNGYTLNPF